MLRQVAEPVKANRRIILSEVFSEYAGEANWRNADLVSPQYNHDGFVRAVSLKPYKKIVETFGWFPREGGGPSHVPPWERMREVEAKFEKDSPLLEIMENIIGEAGGWHH